MRARRAREDSRASPIAVRDCNEILTRWICEVWTKKSPNTSRRRSGFEKTKPGALSRSGPRCVSALALTHLRFRTRVLLANFTAIRCVLLNADVMAVQRVYPNSCRSFITASYREGAHCEPVIHRSQQQSHDSLTRLASTQHLSTRYVSTRYVLTRYVLTRYVPTRYVLTRYASNR